MICIHFDTGEALLMPMSGRHSIMKCGRTFQDSYAKDNKRKTADKDKVTCKICRRLLAK